MKSGANKSDLNTIKRMHEEGDDADFISHSLQIDIDTVKSFLPVAKKEVKSKSKEKLADKPED